MNLSVQFVTKNTYADTHIQTEHLLYISFRERQLFEPHLGIVQLRKDPTFFSSNFIFYLLAHGGNYQCCYGIVTH